MASLSKAIRDFVGPLYIVVFTVSGMVLEVFSCKVNSTNLTYSCWSCQRTVGYSTPNCKHHTIRARPVSILSMLLIPHDLNRCRLAFHSYAALRAQSSHTKVSVRNYLPWPCPPSSIGPIWSRAPPTIFESSSTGARKADNLGERSFGRVEFRAFTLFDFVEPALTGSRALLRDVRPGSSAGRSPGSSHLLKGRAPSSYGPGPAKGFVESCLSSRCVGVVGDPTSTSVEEVSIDQICWAWEGGDMACLSASYNERAVRSW